MPSLPSVLIVDDEVRSQESLRRTLEEDFEVFTASGAAEARAILEGQTCEIVLTDQRMPGVSGVEFLKEVQRDWPDSVRIVISGYTDSQDIIAGINEAGIYQYLLKPWHPEQLLLTLKRAAELYRLQRENCQLAVELRAALPMLRGRVEATRKRVKRAFALDRIVRTPGSPMGAVCDLVERAARFDVAVLLCGESGTGKELLARAIHYASPRAERAFVVENCGALPDSLLESELFGHKRGSFTGAHEDRIGLFQQADGGTLFLDEIGETSPAFQVKLLRVLQEGECRPVGGRGPIRVDVRLITATNRDLEAEVKAGRFREDLYYRLATVPLRLPPLRERPQDIPVLAGSVLINAAAALGRPVEGLAAATLDCLAAYPWPGNVRELQNEIQRMLVLSDGPILTPDLLAPHIRQAGLATVLGEDAARGLRGRVDALEGQLLAETLARHGGNISRAARELGLSRLGLRNKMQRLGLERPGKAG
jgi:two-component system, NtrC family, response regulator HupR/HoxA